MMNQAEAVRRISPQSHLCNLTMFFTGAALGCLLIRFSGQQLGVSFAEAGFFDVLLANGKFLVLLYLLAHIHAGAALIPPVFGLEGLLLGSACGAVFAGQGVSGLAALGLCMAFRLLLVLPYGFLLGHWAVGQCLGEGAEDTRLSVLLVTLLVLAAASLLECSAGHWLCRLYYLNVGV